MSSMLGSSTEAVLCAVTAVPLLLFAFAVRSFVTAPKASTITSQDEGKTKKVVESELSYLAERDYITLSQAKQDATNSGYDVDLAATDGVTGDECATRDGTAIAPLAIMFSVFIVLPIAWAAILGVPASTKAAPVAISLKGYFITWVSTCLGAPFTTVGINAIVSFAFGELKTLSWSDVKSDIFLTVGTAWKISPLVACIHMHLWEGAFGSVYSDPNEYPLWWSFFVGPIVALLVSDSCFYWGHRAMHTFPVLYKWHAPHHSYKPPKMTAFSVSAQDVGDMLLQGLCSTFLPAILVPMHRFAFIWLFCFAEMFGAFSHLSYGTWVHVWLGNSIFHGIHHYFGFQNYNHAFFFTHWDRWCGTFKAAYPLVRFKRFGHPMPLQAHNAFTNPKSTSLTSRPKVA